MQKRVLGEGPNNPKIIIVGEAPGYYEDRDGKPFVGPSGKELNSLLRTVGIRREECWVTNVVKLRPPDNDIKRLHEVGTDLIKERDSLFNELKVFNPNIYIALGNIALEALTGKSGINDWRGSILQSKLGPKVVATFHPANFLRTKDNKKPSPGWYRYVATLDLNRAKEESYTKELNLPYRNLIVCKDPLQLWNFLREDSEFLSIDIESKYCLPYNIGLSFHKHTAISIPFTNRYNPNPMTGTQFKEIWRLLGKVVRDPKYKKIGQNFKYDDDKLAMLGLNIDALYADTMMMMHTCYPELPKSLAFTTSIFTREPYYKDEGKEFNPKKDSIDQLYRYNARDAAVTLEVFEALDKELAEVGTKDFYYSYVSKLHKFYSRIERDGFAVDSIQKEILSEKYNTLLNEAQRDLDFIAQRPINCNSHVQVKDLLFNQLDLPKRESSGEDDLVALLGNHAKEANQRDAINLILDIRRYQKTLSTYVDINTDYDGRVRTSYRICGTETGRSSTGILEAPIRPFKTGLAFQTITKHGTIGTDVRSYLIPDQDD